MYLDTETCGFHGMMVTLQYARDDGAIKIWNVWKERICDTLQLLEEIASGTVVGFNLAFDWFHFAKIYTTFLLFPDHTAIPEDHIEELAILEEKARFSNICIKPKSAFDLMLYCRKGPYQSLMKRRPITIKKIPTVLAEILCGELESRVKLDDIYFAKRKDKYAPQWSVRDITDSNGDMIPGFKDIVLKFNASGALKVLAQHVLKIEKDLILKFTDIEPDKYWRPKEFGYAPFALAVGKPGRWNWAWPEVIKHHIEHWAYNDLAIRYAGDDVKHVRDLYYHFGRPEVGDDDSILACLVACVRWRGFSINIDAIKSLREKANQKQENIPQAPNAVKGHLGEVMNDMEKMVLLRGTNVEVLEEIEKWLIGKEKHPAAERATEVIHARKATKEIEVFDKLLKAKRFHASYEVIGARSSRMSGKDDLNPQGIKKSNEFRSCFTLFDAGFILCGGDFDQFEVVISEAVYKDLNLRKDLLSGKKLHALLAMEVFPGKTHEEIMLSKGADEDFYADGKSAVFALNYGGTDYTLQKNLGVSEEVAKNAFDNFLKKYPGITEARERIKEKFCSMRQPGGIGSAVEWHEPSEYIESLLSFRRYFTLENKICKALFNLAQKPPKLWRSIKLKVNRRDKMQTASGAVQSALYAAAFAIQSSNMRAAANHEIQSTGAGITKRVQCVVWEFQPCGVSEWKVQPFNIHDEVIAPVKPELVYPVSKKVAETVESYKSIIPLIKMDWSIGMKTWVDK